MQSTLVLLLIVTFGSINANEENDNWPCYLKKCERNASDFDSCLFYHANRGLAYILKGDEDAGIPKLVPSSLDTYVLGKNKKFKIYLREISLYGFNYFDVYNMRWDLNNKKIFLELHFSNTLRLSATYSAFGQFGNRFLTSDSGKLDFVYGGPGAITYNMTYQTKLHNGMNYATIDKCQATRKNSYIRYRLDNRTNDKGGAANELSDSDAMKLDHDLDPELNELICYIINSVFRPLFYNFPIDLMFD